MAGEWSYNMDGPTTFSWYTRYLLSFSEEELYEFYLKLKNGEFYLTDFDANNHYAPDILYIEKYNPDKAWSDASQQVTPQDCISLIDNVMWRAKTANDPEFNNELNVCRQQIDQIDSELFDLLSQRMQTAEKIGRIKKANNVAILQSSRWEDICRRMINLTRGMNLSEEFVRSVLEAIHVESMNHQNEIMNNK